MRHWGTITLSLACLAPAPAAPTAIGAESEYALEVSPVGEIHATLTCDISVPDLRAEEWILCVARPPELPSQTGIKVRMSPRGRSTRDLSPRKHPLLIARVPARRKTYETRITVRVEYQATLIARNLVRRKPDVRYAPVAPMSRKERGFVLATSTIFDFESREVRRWMDRLELDRREKEGQVAFAERVFRMITGNFSYDYREKMDRRASRVCQAGQSDCGGLAALFVSVLRSNRIPARLLSGRWTKSAVAGKRIGGIAYQQQHVKAEFYADGVGWIPVDLSSAILDDRSPEGLRYFGHDPGDFLTLHLDNALVLDTIHFGRKKLLWLQGLAYWVVGSGSIDTVVIRRDWQVRDEK